jgi:uncharacterized protein (DUF1499 family)
MSMALTLRASAASGWIRATAYAGLLLAVVALLLLAAGPLGWRMGWWNYRLAFRTLMPDAFYCGAAAIGVSAVALAISVSLRRFARRGLVPAALGLIIGVVAVYFPWHASESRGAAPMHDITTDAANPPSFAFAAAARAAERGAGADYPGPETMAMQQKFYPGIEPAMVAMPPPQAFDRVLAVARAKGWTIANADPATGVIEACERSFWFGFTDDIAIRVTPAENGSRVDVRSGARQGRGDLGVNAARVRGFLAALKETTQ